MIPKPSHNRLQQPQQRCFEHRTVFVLRSVCASVCIMCYSTNNQFITQTVKLLRFENSKLEFYLPKMRVRNLLWASRSSQKQTWHFWKTQRQRQKQREKRDWRASTNNWARKWRWTVEFLPGYLSHPHSHTHRSIILNNQPFFDDNIYDVNFHNTKHFFSPSFTPFWAKHFRLVYWQQIATDSTKNVVNIVTKDELHLSPV